MKKLVMLVVVVLALGTFSWAGDMTMSGVISDSHCGAKHSAPGATDCVNGCVKGGAKYVLVSDGKVYDIDAQDKVAEFAGKSVKITGSCDGKTVTVKSVEAGK
jgi:hypothetical protein